MSNKKYMYRYELHNGFIHIERYIVVGDTPKGHWVIYGFIGTDNEDWVRKNRKWVSNYTRKRLCYPTKDEAWYGFIKRKERQLKILKSQIETLEHMFATVKKRPDENFVDTRTPQQKFTAQELLNNELFN